MKAIRSSLHRLTADGVFTQAMGALTGGPFLIAYAAALGASHVMVGLLAALPFLPQLLQLPAAVLLSRYGHRRRVVVLLSILGRLAWLVPAAAPWLVQDESLLLALLLGALLAYFSLTAVATCAYSSWVRDLVPDESFGRHFGRQLALGTAVAAALRLVAGAFLDHSSAFGDAARPFGLLFGSAVALGVTGSLLLRNVEDPPQERAAQMRIRDVLGAPLRSIAFRPLLVFGGVWSFAINLAAPFVTLYLLDRLAMSMTWIVGLSVLSKIVNVAFFPMWGKLADRFANKSVLGVSVGLSVFVMMAWPFTTLPDRHAMTVPLLLLIHVAAGVSTAGVTLGLNNIALKLAPRSQAAPFLAANAMINGLASSVAPLLAGLAADALSQEHLAVSLAWSSADEVRVSVGALDLRGLDFLFVASAILGVYALHRLSVVREEGEVQERVVLDALYGEVRQAVREVSSLSGLGRLVDFPSGMIRWAADKTGISEPEEDPPQRDDDPR